MTMKILSIDIETSPNLAYSFELRNAFIGIDQIVEPSRMLCFAARWNDERMQFYSEFHHGADQMVQKAYDLLEEADVVMHYNGKKFDERRMNNEFYRRGMTRPAPYRRIDLWRASVDAFDFPSSKLAYILRESELPSKVETGGFGLWRGCLDGDPRSWAKMRRYCIQDTKVLWPLYLKMRSWIPGHPSRAIGNGFVCTNCASPNLERRGYRETQVGRYQAYRCRDCGSWCQDTRRSEGSELRQVAA